jgi:hypothetical protein
MRAAETVPTFCTQASRRERASRQRTRRLFFCLTLAAASAAESLSTPSAQAQPAPAPVLTAEPPPPPPAAPPPPLAPTEYKEVPVVSGPVAPEPKVLTTAPAQEPALAEPQPIDPPKEEKPSLLAPKLKIGIGVRTGLSMSLNNPSDNVKLSLDDGIGDLLLIRPYFSGELTKNVGVVANFQVVENGKSGVGFSVLDAIAQVKVVDEFQVWVGQHIPANDRTNFSGPFFHNGWQFPITVPSFPFDAGARSRGVTFWGLVAGGILKYHASVVDLQKGRSIQNARLGARVTINLLDPENYYYSSGTYYGAQDTLAIGGVIQYQKGIGATTGDGLGGPPAADLNGDGMVDNDFLGGAVDLLAEKNFGKLGTYTFEGGYWNFNGSGKDYVVNQGTATTGIGFTGPQPGQSFTMMFSWLTPGKVGIGQIQPNFRVQWADYDKDSNYKTYDAGLAYVVDGFNHRWHLNYRHSESPVGTSSVKDDSIQLGAQMQL